MNDFIKKIISEKVIICDSKLRGYNLSCIAYSYNNISPNGKDNIRLSLINTTFILFYLSF